MCVTAPWGDTSGFPGNYPQISCPAGTVPDGHSEATSICTDADHAGICCVPQPDGGAADGGAADAG
jgi:hypothetical protein